MGHGLDFRNQLVQAVEVIEVHRLPRQIRHFAVKLVFGAAGFRPDGFGLQFVEFLDNCDTRQLRP